MSVDWLINLKPLRDPIGSQIKLDELRIFLSSSKGKCSRSSPLIGDDLHFCLDLRTGGPDESLHQQPLESGPEQLRCPGSRWHIPDTDEQGPASVTPECGLFIWIYEGKQALALVLTLPEQVIETPCTSVSLQKNGDLNELWCQGLSTASGPKQYLQFYGGGYDMISPNTMLRPQGLLRLRWDTPIALLGFFIVTWRLVPFAFPHHPSVGMGVERKGGFLSKHLFWGLRCYGPKKKPGYGMHGSSKSLPWGTSLIPHRDPCLFAELL